MSCYEWEKGEIKLPKAEWVPFRKALIQAHNDEKLSLFNSALGAHAKMVESSKGLRGDNRFKKQVEVLKSFVPDYERYSSHFELLFVAEEGSYHRTKLVLPKKKDLGLLPLTADCKISLVNAQIFLRNDTCSVIWSVPENNRACDHARQEPLAQTMFRLLDRVTWTRGSGGSIVGNDEYNREADYEGGGGNYIKSQYGPEKARMTGRLW
jgi:hypothetical protein